MPTILCAPDSFKETLSAPAAAEAMARGAEAANRSICADRCPIADGGEGSLDALVDAMRGTRHARSVTGPRGEHVNACFAIARDPQSSERVGIIELAQASGITLLPEPQRDPMQTTTFGTGELMRAAIDEGCSRIIICIGGSATCDGATGLVQAIGGRFFDENGNEISEPLTGGRLKSIARVELPADLPPIEVACDVTNPLLGVEGAAAVYGPQKGATPEQVRELDDALAHLASIVGGNSDAPGSGASGGAGFGLTVMCGAMLRRGIELVLDAVDFDSRCKCAQLVLTGEGKLDGQSIAGKACMGVAEAAAKLGVPTIAIVGTTGEGAERTTDRSAGGWLHSYVSLSERFGAERARSDAAACIEEVAREVVGECLNIGR